MARNYAALPHDYLEEMDILSDAEFGRLCRALLRYSRDGEEVQLEGTEKVLLKRVFMQERRFQESYKEQIEGKRSAGKKGAAKRWHNIADDGTAINAIADDGKNGYKETKTETKTETNIPPSIDGRDTPARANDPAVAAVMQAYVEKISPTPSTSMVSELVGFVEAMGPDCCLKAINIALDANARSWRYIKAILQDKQAKGVRSLADWDAVESRHTPRQDRKGRPKGPLTDIGPINPAEARKDMARMEKYLNTLRGDAGHD